MSYCYENSWNGKSVCVCARAHVRMCVFTSHVHVWILVAWYRVDQRGSATSVRWFWEEGSRACCNERNECIWYEVRSNVSVLCYSSRREGGRWLCIEKKGILTLLHEEVLRYGSVI